MTKSGGSTIIHYYYDYENRLIQIQEGGFQTDYVYDVDGVRVSSNTDGDITNYLADRNRPYAQVLEERDGSGSLTVDYVHGDDLISQHRGGGNYFYLYDGQMSTRQLTDASEDAVNEYTYDAFGIVLNQVGVVANTYLYTGEQYDPNAGFYYLRARYYNQDIGRFVTNDPWEGNISEPISLHKYLYAANDPVNKIDPTGMFADLGSMMVAISLNTILSTIKTPTASASFLAIPILPSEKTRRQLVGLIYAESGTTEWGGENAEEKSAIGSTVINRAYYATLTPASGHGVCYNQPGFGSGTIWSAITSGEFRAYGKDMWNEVMSGDDMKSTQQLETNIRTMSKRLHLINSVSAANSLPSFPQLVELGILGGRASIAFNRAINSPPNPARMEKIGRHGSHSFYGFIIGRECE